MASSSQHRLAKVRKPRVHITYDLHIGDTREKKELPLVVGILSDLYGHNKNADSFKERRFTRIEKSNFNKVLEKIAPQLEFLIKDKSKNDADATKRVEFKFKSIEDFSPDNFVQQSEDLNKLLMKRKLLTDLLAKLDGNEGLGNILLEMLKAPDKRKELAEAA